MPNLVKNLHISLKDLYKDKIMLAFIALIAAVAFNQVVFSFLLVGRDQAKADAIVFGNDSIGDTNYPQLIAQMESILPPADREPGMMVVDEAGGYAYLGTAEWTNVNKIIKIRLSDFTRVASLQLPDCVWGTNMVTTALVDHSSIYAYFGVSCQKVYRLRLSDFSLQGDVDMVAGNNYSAAIDSNYAYFGDGGLIERIALASFTYAGNINTGGNLIKAQAMDEANGYAYFGDANWGMGPGDSANIYKVRLSDFTLQGTITLAAGENIDSYGMGIDGTTLWVGDVGFPPTLMKVNLADFTRDSSGDIDYGTALTNLPVPPYPSGILNVVTPNGMIIDSTNHLAYMSIEPWNDGNWPSRTLIKIDLTVGPPAPADVEALMLDSLKGTTYIAAPFAIDFTNGQAYLSGPGYPAYVEKVDLATFTRNGVLPLDVTISYAMSSVIDTDPVDGYLYLASGTNPQAIAKIKLADFSFADVLPLDSSRYFGVAAAGIDKVDHFAYFTATDKLGGDHPVLLKIDIDPNNALAIVDEADLSGYAFRKVLIDPDNDKAYLSEFFTVIGVVKVDLTTMTLEDTLTLPVGNYAESISTGVIDVANQFVYFATAHPNDGSGRIFRVNLASFDEADTLTLNLSAIASEKLFSSSVIDTVNGYAYFRTVFGPLVKINVSPSNFARVGAITIAARGGIDDNLAGIDMNLGYAFFISGGVFGGADWKINQIDINPARPFAVLSQTDLSNNAGILADPDKGFLYLINNTDPVGIDKYSYTLVGYIHAYKVTLTRDIPEVDYFSFYSNEAAGDLKFALYDASKTLIWESNEVINTVADSWLRIPVSGGTPATITNLPAGDYYLAFQTDTTAPVATQVSGGEGFKLVRRYDDGFPTSITSGDVATTNEWSFYGAIHTADRVGEVAGSTIPAAPTNLTCQALNESTIRWSFIDPETTETGFVLYGPAGKILDSGLNIVTDLDYFDETGLTPNTLYGSRYVTAFNGSGESAPSNIASCTTLNVGEEVLPSPEQTGSAGLPVGYFTGDLVKLDQNSTVYLLASNGKRRVFPTEAIFRSWYENDPVIKNISSANLEKIPLGANMIVRPGTYLIKIVTDPKVYAVEANGVLRWISNETLAKTLYGSSWAQRVIDMPDVYFVDYQAGEAINQPIHSNGALIKYEGQTNIYYVENSKKRLVVPEAFTQNLFQNRFVLTISQADLSKGLFSYSEGMDFPIDYDYTMTMVRKTK